MATHTLDATDTAANLRTATAYLHEAYAGRMNKSLRDAVLTLEGMADALDAGDGIVFEGEDVDPIGQEQDMLDLMEDVLKETGQDDHNGSEG